MVWRNGPATTTSPAGTEFVYLWRDNANPFLEDEIRIGDWAELAGPTLVAKNPSGASQAPSGGTNIIGWSPDGQQIYYRGLNDNTSGDSEVRVVNRDGTGNTLLWISTAIGPVSWGFRPRLSPDGTQIALWVDFDGGADRGLWVMDSDGTNMTKIYAAIGGAYPDDFYGWSPDGSRLLFMDSDQISSPRFQWIKACDPDGSNVVNLYTRQTSGSPIEAEIVLPVGPIWHPDGTKVACRYDLGGTDPRHRISWLATNGSEAITPLSPERRAWRTMVGLVVHYGPVVFYDRIYWTEGNVAGAQRVVSTDFDGGNYLVDDDMDTDPIGDDYQMNGFWETAA